MVSRATRAQAARLGALIESADYDFVLMGTADILRFTWQTSMCKWRFEFVAGFGLSPAAGLALLLLSDE